MRAGIRSDSDMHTLGYRFRPWTEAKAIADGPSILQYVRDTAREAGIDRHVRFGHRVLRAAWSSRDARWVVEAECDGEPVTLTAGVLQVCSGYYRYDEGFTPRWEGMERFGGQLVHPQHRPEGLDVADKRVVVVGSGATAVTLVPALAEQGARVTMLQRSPSYVPRPELGRGDDGHRPHRVAGVPNLTFTIGSTNASWTLKADLVSEYLVRLLRHMDATGTRQVVPIADPTVVAEPFLDFQAGYVLRALDQFPRQGPEPAKEPIAA